MYIKAKGEQHKKKEKKKTQFEMFVAVFLHMIIVGDKASWLKGVPRFINTDFF